MKPEKKTEKVLGWHKEGFFAFVNKIIPIPAKINNTSSNKK